YRENNENNAAYLLNIREEAAKQVSTADNKYAVYDTHLKRNYQDIKLSFKFTGLKSVPQKDIIAYTAIGSYNKGKQHKEEGWDGIRVFFAKPYGICSYQFMHIINAMLPKETTQYFVNN